MPMGASDASARRRGRVRAIHGPVGIADAAVRPRRFERQRWHVREWPEPVAPARQDVGDGLRGCRSRHWGPRCRHGVAEELVVDPEHPTTRITMMATIRDGFDAEPVVAMWAHPSLRGSATAAP